MIQKILIFGLFSILFLLSTIIKGVGVLGLYGAVLLLYLLAKMTLSFFYKPFGGKAKKGLRIDCVIPSYNENGEGLIETLESLAQQTYPIRAIYLIDDGSPDSKGFEMAKNHIKNNSKKFKNVITHRLRRNRGKRHAQAWAFKISNADMFLTVDSDSYIYPNALEELVKCFNNPKIFAATGHINARNRDKNLLTRLIDIRYDNAFRVERAAQSMTGNILTCSGPLSLYKREVIIPNLKHYTNQYFLGVKVNIGDDRCLTNYAARLGRTAYQSTARCDTDVPNNLRVFAKQQIRWNKSFFRESLIALSMFARKPLLSVWSFLEVVLWVLLMTSTINLLVGNFGRIDFWWVAGAVAVISISALFRNVHYAVKHPLLFLLSPFYGFIHIFLLQPIRLYALLTLRDVRWGTRVFKPKK